MTALPDLVHVVTDLPTKYSLGNEQSAFVLSANIFLS